MPAKTVKKYLDDHNIKYLTLEHPPAYTAQEVAAAAHVSGNTFAKTVVIEVDGRMAMAVVHAHDKLDIGKLKKSIGSKNVRLASEEEFKEAFAECEVGAMPPFGNLYGMEVFVERDIPSEHDIVFSAGTHHEVMSIAYKDFAELVNPITLSMTKH